LVFCHNYGVKELPVAEAKRTFSEVLDAAGRGEETLVLRHGKPVALVTPVPEAANQPRRPLPKAREAGGLLSLVGLFDDWETMDEDLTEIVAERQGERGRPVPDLGTE
jgi:prevent-host-death family protein